MNWKEVSELFSDAMDLPAAQRDGFLAAHCNDPETIAEVQRLIRLESKSEDFLSQPINVDEPAAPDLEEGQILSERYRIERRIGAGGMCGGVYEALDLRHGTPVALKTVCDAGEFQLARRVTHVNVCRVFDCDRDGAIPFLTMELLCGQTLEDHLRTVGPLSEDQLQSFATQLVAGLKASHESGVLHCDLKPANILLASDGRVVIADFGLARPLHAADPQQPQLAGTLSYMAPELLDGKPASVASDLYSLGVVLHEAATGRLPGEPSRLPATVKRVIRCCLQIDPALRPKSANSVEKILQSIENRVRGILRFWPQTTSPACSTIARLASPQLGRISTPDFITLSGLPW